MQSASLPLSLPGSAVRRSEILWRSAGIHARVHSLLFASPGLVGLLKVPLTCGIHVQVRWGVGLISVEQMPLNSVVGSCYERIGVELATPTWCVSCFCSGTDVLVSVLALLICSRHPGRAMEQQSNKDFELLKPFSFPAFLPLISVHKCNTGVKIDKNLQWDYVLWAANNVEEPLGLLFPQQRCNKAGSWKIRVHQTEVCEWSFFW